MDLYVCTHCKAHFEAKAVRPGNIVVGEIFEVSETLRDPVWEPPAGVYCGRLPLCPECEEKLGRWLLGISELEEEDV